MPISRYTRAPFIKGGKGLSHSEACYVIRKAVVSGALAHSKIIIKSGDRLDHIAHSAYGNGRLWWVIAAASGIGWALQVPPGTIVWVPSDLGLVASMVG